MDRQAEVIHALNNLQAHWSTLTKTSIRALLEADPERSDRFTIQFDDLLFDFSRQKMTDETIRLLSHLADVAELPQAVERLFSGEPVNSTEGRPALHMALRARTGHWPAPDGGCARERAQAVRERMRSFAERLRANMLLGATGSAINHVVSLGVGGSDLGPHMASQVFQPFANGPNVHYISNVDGIELQETLEKLHPRNTLVHIASKSFTTLETMENATTAKAWLEATLGQTGAKKHMSAATTNVQAARDFGINEDYIFEFWNWVGGRYSLWSSVGLSLPIMIGWQRFEEFLDGAAEIDQHFRSAPITENIPMMLAMIGIWNRNILGHASLSLNPYDHRLRRFPAYLQQLEMESNGKRTNRAGGLAMMATSPILFGEPGTNCQHSYLQLLHQGFEISPADFFLAAQTIGGTERQHHLLAANCFAQLEALALGLTEEEAREMLAKDGKDPARIDQIAPHMACPGDRPASLFLYRRLDPRTLGRLLAIYEHKVYAQGVIWDVESFDQWGVELGKRRAKILAPMVSGEAETEEAHPCSHRSLKHYRSLQFEVEAGAPNQKLG
ncbi:MAG: glucose-6-phosphate isomerase [Neomegalonema sp.]|nr:glucose-6-phosphate isomerase [Neomegalonema sp.]